MPHRLDVVDAVARESTRPSCASRGVSRRCRSHTGIDLVTDKPEPELDEDGNELPVKVVELTDEELAARCIVLNKSITLTTFNYLRRGLFEKDKFTVATLVTHAS